MAFSINLLDYISEEKPVEDTEVNSLMPRGRSAKSEVAKMDSVSDPYSFLGDFAEKMREAFQSPEDFERVFMKASKPISTPTPKAQTRAAAITSALEDAQSVPLETPNIQADVPEVPEVPMMRTPTGGIMSNGADVEPYTTAPETTSLPAIRVDVGEQGGLLDFIAAGEGGYNSSHRGTIKDSIIGSTHDTKRNGKSLTEMTIGEIQTLQKLSDPNDKNRLFAVGRYQAIPSTLDAAVKDLGLSADTVFDEATQDKIGLWLVGEKRPEVGSFLRGEDVSLDTAMTELAKEFASVPVPRDMKDHKGRPIKAGQSYYHHTGGNRAGHSIEATRRALLSARKKD